MGENTNSFGGATKKPTEAAIKKALGTSAGAWQELLAHLEKEFGLSEQEWKGASPKYGWSLRLKSGTRTIIYLSPGEGCFTASLALGDKAIQVLKQSPLPPQVREAIGTARRYAEGTGVRLVVKKTCDLEGIRELVAAKLNRNVPR